MLELKDKLEAYMYAQMNRPIYYKEQLEAFPSQIVKCEFKCNASFTNVILSVLNWSYIAFDIHIHDIDQIFIGIYSLSLSLSPWVCLVTHSRMTELH